MIVFPATCPLFEIECFREFEPCRKKCPYKVEMDISPNDFKPTYEEVIPCS